MAVDPSGSFAFSRLVGCNLLGFWRDGGSLYENTIDLCLVVNFLLLLRNSHCQFFQFALSPHVTSDELLCRSVSAHAVRQEK